VAVNNTVLRKNCENGLRRTITLPRKERRKIFYRRISGRKSLREKRLDKRSSKQFHELEIQNDMQFLDESPVASFRRIQLASGICRYILKINMKIILEKLASVPQAGRLTE
jgi:hypothetical protein